MKPFKVKANKQINQTIIKAMEEPGTRVFLAAVGPLYSMTPLLRRLYGHALSDTAAQPGVKSSFGKRDKKQSRPTVKSMELM